MQLRFSSRVALALLASVLALPAGASSQVNTLKPVANDVDMAHNIINVGLASGNPHTRVEAIAATGMIAKSEPVRRRVEGFLKDKDVTVRVAAVETLADLDFDESIPALEKVLNTDPAPEVEFAVAKALYKLNDPKGKWALEEVLYGRMDAKSGFLTRQKRDIFAHFHSAHGVTTFLLTTGGGFVPVPGAGEGLSEVARLMDDSALSPRATIVLLLGREHGPKTDKLLRFSLKDKDWTVRASAVLMIALTGRQDMRQDLVPLLSDNDARVRFRAAGAYLHLIGAQSVP